ncbi:MAG: hypothetical protein IT289_06295 [Oligoflexia bacterium]|nr:hypothetical protein [Oligoflexia bacterium]
MKNLEWVRDLVESELRMEETGMIDLSGIPDETRDVQAKTNEFLKEIKEAFIEYSTAFNNMKNSAIGGVKIYGISNTVADFMLFRNGYKLLFAALEPGRIAISFQAQAAQILPLGAQSINSNSTEEYLDAKYGPFGELSWTYRGTPVNLEPLVRYYLTRFVRESAK